MKKRNKVFTLKEIAIIAIFSSFFMFFLGGLSVYKKLGGINYTILGNDKELKKFINTYETLVYNYYGKIDKSTIISGAINGMYTSLNDPYTTYLDQQSTDSINDVLNGQYTGIGIILEDRDGKVQICDVLDDSPANISGLLKGDVIIGLNNFEVRNLSSTDISELIKASGDIIELTISRNDSIKTFKLDKESLLVPNVKKDILMFNDKKVGYIFLGIFNDTADIQFEDAIYSLEKEGIDSLIIDLRNNTGGYLEVAKNIAELFLRKDKLIYSLVTKNQEIKYLDITNESRDYKVAVLVNSKTASAAEILAASLKYSYGATIYGNRTYGKGKVQQKSDFLDGSSIKYTTAKWFMPNGKCIDGIGIQPDIEVSLDEELLIKDDIYSDTQILYTLKNLVD